MPGTVTITVPAVTSQLTTLANAKGDLNVNTTTDDAYITGLINRASSVVADYCGCTFGNQTVTEIFRFGSGSYIGPSAQNVAPYGTPLASNFAPISFTVFPVNSIVSIIENSDSALTLGVDFDMDDGVALAWRVRNGLRSWWGVPTVTAVYTAGYVLPNDAPISGVRSLPGAVEEAAISLVRNAYMRRGRDPSVILDLVEGVGRVGYAKVETVSGMAIDSALASILQPYSVILF